MSCIRRSISVSISVDIVWRAWDPQINIFCMNTLTRKLMKPPPLPFHTAHSNSSQSPMNTKHSYHVIEMSGHPCYLLEAMNQKYQYLGHLKDFSGYIKYLNQFIFLYLFFHFLFWKIGYLGTRMLTGNRWPWQFSHFLIKHLWHLCLLDSESEWYILLCLTLTRFRFWCWEITACSLRLGVPALNASPNTLIEDLDYVESCRFPVSQTSCTWGQPNSHQDVLHTCTTDDQP